MDNECAGETNAFSKLGGHKDYNKHSYTVFRPTNLN